MCDYPTSYGHNILNLIIKYVIEFVRRILKEDNKTTSHIRS